MSRILVVDDDELIVEALLACLSLESMDAVGVCSAEQARSLLAQEPIAIVLTDVRLEREHDGVELVRDIRDLNPTTRVATLTGYATPELERELAALGARVVLHKPVGAEVVVQVVREMLAEIEREARECDGPVELEALYRVTRRLLMSIAVRRYGFPREDAEELLQEAWCLYLEQQQSVRAARPWLAGTVVNLCRREHGRRARYVPDEDLGETLLEAFSDDRIVLEQGMDRLDERSRMLLQMAFVEERSYEEISRKTGVAVGSIGPLLIRARKKLREVYDEAPRRPATRVA